MEFGLFRVETKFYCSIKFTVFPVEFDIFREKLHLIPECWNKIYSFSLESGVLRVQTVNFVLH